MTATRLRLGRMPLEVSAALNDEIAARRRGGERVRLANGRLLGPSTHGWLYEFRLEQDTPIPDDCVEVEVDRKRVEGTVVMREGFDLVLELEVPAGGEPAVGLPDHQAVVHPRGPARPPERVGGAAGARARPVRRPRPRAGYAPGGAPGGRVRSRRTSASGADGLNARQHLAVGRALAQPVTFIWGLPAPERRRRSGIWWRRRRRGSAVPGAGAQQRRLDVAMLAVARRFGDDARRMAGRVVRFGTASWWRSSRFSVIRSLRRRQTARSAASSRTIHSST